MRAVPHPGREDDLIVEIISARDSYATIASLAGINRKLAERNRSGLSARSQLIVEFSPLREAIELPDTEPDANRGSNRSEDYE